MAESPKKIIILGSSTKAGVYVTKQLKKYGLHITVIDWLDSPVRFSKYIDQFIILPSPIYDENLFIDSFIALLQKDKFDCILPIHDPAVEICSVYETQLNKYSKIIGLNPKEIQIYASDKSVLFKLAEEIGIRVPKGILIDKLEDIDNVIEKITFPCVMKPVRSALLKDNHIYKFSVKIAHDKYEIIDFVRENINNVKILLQEYIEGYGIGYNIFSKNGEILNAYIHRRINEYNGISSYRESLSPNEYNLKEPVTELIRRIKWNGVAMIEFKIHDNIPFLMEMNGRFWGSIDVGIKSGLNYPVMLYESEFLNKEVPSNITVKRVRVRNLKDEVIIYFDKLLKQGKVKEFAKWIWSLTDTFKKNNLIEDNLFDNPAFVLATYYYELNRVFKKLILKLKLRLLRIKYHKPSFEKNKQYLIAFACAGNICRSPFAEKYAQKIKPEYKFISFGTSPYDHRLSPANAVKAASEFDIDLSSSQSTSINSGELNNVDFIFIFDKKNYLNLTNRGVDNNKILFISDDEITDPYGKDEKVFINQYTIIKNSIDKLFSVNN